MSEEVKVTVRQMGLSECAKWDFERKLKDVVTGWGRICKDRHVRGVSRKARKLRRQQESA